MYRAFLLSTPSETDEYKGETATRLLLEMAPSEGATKADGRCKARGVNASVDTEHVAAIAATKAPLMVSFMFSWSAEEKR